jgi:hypothetical protein
MLSLATADVIDRKWIGEIYQGFMHGVQNVEWLFKAKFGREPARVIMTGGGVLAGPITLTELKASQRKEFES